MTLLRSLCIPRCASAALRLVAAAAGLASGCAGPAASSPPASGPSVVVVEAPSPAAGPAPVAADPHYLAADDYLVRVSMNNDVAHVAKQLAAPTEPAGEGVFLSGRNGQEIRSTEFWRSRPAGPSDALVGATLFCFEGNWSGTDGIRHAPRNPDEARGSLWTVGRVTDTSELGQDIVRVGSRRCGLDALRAPLE